ncbi:MAG: hypothetical protein M1826_007747 [Phylliscum demangeonii]|nr:MAG: hypothetical protein M1826_007747 [Phylliscum demangeonii]
MSGSYERYERRLGRPHRTALGYWLPLALTVTVATAGLAAWAWSTRSDGEDDNNDDDDEEEEAESRPDERAAFAPPPRADEAAASTAYQSTTQGTGSLHGRGDLRGPEEVTAGVRARVSDAIRRTPSPQQIFDQASKKVAAGVAAAGAAVGGALWPIGEESKEDYGDHSRWSEEAGRRVGPEREKVATATVDPLHPTSEKGPITGAPRAAISSTTAPHQASVKRKAVAVVISAEADGDGHSHPPHDHHEDASLLSHLPEHIDLAKTQLVVLIYAPDVKPHAPSASSAAMPPASVTSSFSNIAAEEAASPGEEVETPLRPLGPEPIGTAALAGAEPSLFQPLYAQARALVEQESMVVRFTTASGHVPLLRQLGAEVIYIQESLAGREGEWLTPILAWARQIVVVVGAEGGHGGLVDSDDDAGPDAPPTAKWWQSSDRVGLGKGIDVVDGMRVGEDWRRRVGGMD